MKCYRMDCKDRSNCDKYKMAACIEKIGRWQHRVLLQMFSDNNLICKKCSKKLVNARYKKSQVEFRLCTSCGAVAERQVG